jgi:hypothetical protein
MTRRSTSALQVLPLKAQVVIDRPGTFFGYIDSDGYVSMKRYTTERCYKKIQDSYPVLFIPLFRAKGSGDALSAIKTILKKALECKYNLWDQIGETK